MEPRYALDHSCFTTLRIFATSPRSVTQGGEGTDHQCHRKGLNVGLRAGDLLGPLQAILGNECDLINGREPHGLPRG